MSSHFQSTEGVDQGATGGESQRQRYASFSGYAYWLVRVNMAHGQQSTYYIDPHPR